MMTAEIPVKLLPLTVEYYDMDGQVLERQVIEGAGALTVPAFPVPVGVRIEYGDGSVYDRPPPCIAELAKCDCTLPVGHTEPHVCECGGEWTFGPPVTIRRASRWIAHSTAVRRHWDHVVEVAP